MSRIARRSARRVRRRAGRLLLRAAALLPPSLLPLLPLAGACSTYRAAAPEVVPAGARVRVTLTPEGAAALAPTLGSSVAGVEGEWAGRDGASDSVVVRVARLLTVSGVPIAWSGTPVSIGRGGLQSVERVTVSRPRTALIVAGAAVVAFLAVQLFRGDGAAKGTTGDGGPTPF